MSSPTRWIVGSLAVFALAFAGCSRHEEKPAPAAVAPAPAAPTPQPAPAPPPAPPQASAPSPGVTVSQHLPADFPSDVPLDQKSTVVETRVVGGQGVSVRMTSDDDVDTAARFYADGLAAQGWSTDIRKSPEGQMIFAQKGNRVAGYAVTPGPRGGSQISLIVAEHP